MIPQDLTQAEHGHPPRRTSLFRRPLDHIVSVSRVMCLIPNERAPLAVELKMTSRVLPHTTMYSRLTNWSNFALLIVRRPHGEHRARSSVTWPKHIRTQHHSGRHWHRTVAFDFHDPLLNFLATGAPQSASERYCRSGKRSYTAMTQRRFRDRQCRKQTGSG